MFAWCQRHGLRISGPDAAIECFGRDLMNYARYPLFGAAGHPRRRRVSRRGESHPPPLSGPDVTISRHPAPTVRLEVTAASCQWANSSGWCW